MNKRIQEDPKTKELNKYRQVDLYLERDRTCETCTIELKPAPLIETRTRGRTEKNGARLQTCTSQTRCRMFRASGKVDRNNLIKLTISLV